MHVGDTVVFNKKTVMLFGYVLTDEIRTYEMRFYMSKRYHSIRNPIRFTVVVI